MVQSSTLLQLIQFVGLITPALAILIELLIRFHGGLNELKRNREIPFEVQVLFIGFSAILVGGMTIGVQMTLTLNDTITQIASLMVFGGLPLLAVSVLVMQIRITKTSPSSSLFLGLHDTLKQFATKGTPIILTVILNSGLIWYLDSFLNTHFDYWIFQVQLEPSWYFHGTAFLITYKVIYSIWTHQILEKEIGGIMEDWFVIQFTAMSFFVVLTMPIFYIYYLLTTLNISFLSASSFGSAIPYLWSLLVLIVLLLTEIDPED